MKLFSWRSFFIFLLLLGLLAAGGLFTGKWWLENYLQTPTAYAKDKTLLIEAGTGGNAIATMLESQQIIAHKIAFRIAAMLQKKHRRFQAGEYYFEVGLTPQQIMDKLATGDVVKHKITIPEGKTSAEIVALLAQEPKLTGKIASLPPEGRLLPETYHFQRGESRLDVIKRMAKAQDELLQKLWPTRQENLPISTPIEALALASIVEKETGLPSERRRVAAVYINRLKQNMKLQADPTVSYGLHGGQTNAPALSYADLKKETPYNTYLNYGLPPGPICHAGADSIAAVLDPLKTDELYFVARGDGGHLFATTYTEHLKNVKRYRAWQRANR